MEKQDTNNNVQRVQEAISDELSGLNGVVGDRAAWNETYNFVNGEYPKFVEEQIAERTFIEIRLNIMLFINSTGGVAYGSGFDLKNETAGPIPEGIQKYLSVDSILLRHPDTHSSIKGIILLPEGPMLVASSGTLSKRVIMKGKDELSKLAGSINGMLELLEHTEIERKKADDIRLQNERLLYANRAKSGEICTEHLFKRQSSAQDHRRYFTADPDGSRKTGNGG